MDSELSILKGRGLQQKPTKTTAAPPEALAASEQYRQSVKAFEQAVSAIESYLGATLQPGSSVGVQALIDQAHRLALEIRHWATALSAYPNCFMSIGTEAAFYQGIASAAVDAYESRKSALESLETAFGLGTATTAPYRLIDLALHESFKGGHLAKKHIAQTMRDFERRCLEEERTGRRTRMTFSSFIGDPILGGRDPMVQRVVSRAIHLSQSDIDRAIQGDKIYVPITELTDIGYVKTRGMPPRFTNIGFLVIFKDANHPNGFRIYTAVLGEYP